MGRIYAVEYNPHGSWDLYEVKDNGEYNPKVAEFYDKELLLLILPTLELNNWEIEKPNREWFTEE